MTITSNPQPQDNYGSIGFTTSPDGTTVSSTTSIPPVQLGPIDTTEAAAPMSVPLLKNQYGSTPQHPALASALNTNADGKPMSTTKPNVAGRTAPDTTTTQTPTATDTTTTQTPAATVLSNTQTSTDPLNTPVTTPPPADTSISGTIVADPLAVDTNATDTLGLQGLSENLNVILSGTDTKNTIDQLFGSSYIDNPEDFAGVLNNQIAFSKEAIDAQLAFLKTLPESPEKTNLINFLAAVSEAIGELQEALREMQSFNSEAAMSRSTAQMERSTMTLDATLAAIKEMGDDRVKSAKKEHAMGKLGMSSESIAIIVTSLLILATIPVVIANPVAGVIIMAVLIAVLIDQAMKAGGMEDGLFDYMMQGVEATVNWGLDQFENVTGVSVSDDVRDGFCMVAKAMVIYAIVATTAVFSPAAACAVLPSLMEAAGIGTAMAKLCGGDEKVQQWVEFGLTCAVMIATIVVSFKADTAGKLIQQGADVVEKATTRIGQAITKVVDTLGALGSKLGDLMPDKIVRAIKTALSPDIILNIASTTSQTASVTVNYQNAQLQANITELQGGLDAEIAAKDAIVEVLKDIIKKLLDALTGMNDALETLNTMQASKYQDLSQNIGFAV